MNSFFSRTARHWNSLLAVCFHLTYDINGFKSRVNRQCSLYSFPYDFHLFLFLVIPSLFSLAWSESQLKKNLHITKLYDQQNSSFGLIKFIWYCELEREYFASPRNWTQIHTQTIKKQTLFLPLEQKYQSWKKLQKLNNPVNTIKMRTYANRGRRGVSLKCKRSQKNLLNWAPSS